MRFYKFILMGLTASATIIFCHPVFAYDDERVGINLKDDYGNCALYYQYVLKNVNGATPEQMKSFQISAETAMKMYLKFNEGETTKQIEAHLDFYNIAMSKIYREEGFDRLLVMYSDFCKMMFTNPQPRIEYWKNKQ